MVAEGLRDQGMAVDLAHDGLTAAAKLDLTAYDVVVLDRDLPGLHGDTLCRMITDQAARPNADRFTNTATVTVGRLRRKLGNPPVITTTPGIGYRIG